MSNEELVAAIQSGEDCMGELWEQVEKLVLWKANRVMKALDGRTGVEIEDLHHSGYLALVAAVEGYDPGAGDTFSTWFMFHLKTAFAEATGYRTQKGRKEPLNSSISLDTPLTDDADSDDLMAVIADPSGQKEMESTEEAIYQEQLHDAMETALAAIPEKYADVLRLRYYQDMTLEEAGSLKGVGGERVRQMENRAIRLLRKPDIACRLHPFLDFDFYCGTGLTTFQRTGMSIQERYLVLEEEYKARESRRHRRIHEKETYGRVGTMMEDVMTEVEASVAAMTTEEKRALLEKYGYA